MLTHNHILISSITLAGRDYNISGILPQIGDFPFTRRLSAIDAYVSENWCVFIPIIDDAEVEGNEMFFVKLFTPSVEVIAIHEMVQVTIVDNEGRYYHILPSKRPSLCKRPPPIFDNSIVHMCTV